MPAPMNQFLYWIHKVEASNLAMAFTGPYPQLARRLLSATATVRALPETSPKQLLLRLMRRNSGLSCATTLRFWAGATGEMFGVSSVGSYHRVSVQYRLWAKNDISGSHHAGFDQNEH